MVDLSKMQAIKAASGNAASAAATPAEQSTPLELWQEKNYLELHSEILVYGRATCENLLQMAKGLKRMNDEKLFRAGGYSTFEEYTETALGIKKSQAYTYIKALDTLGEEFFQLTGKIGITKISLLADLTETEREELSQTTDVESATVKELKAKIEELRGEVAEKESKITELEWNAEAERLKTSENPDQPENTEALTAAQSAAEQAQAEAERAREEADAKAAEAAHARADAEALREKIKKLEEDKKKLNDKLKNPPFKEVENAETIAARDRAIAELAEKQAEIERLNKKLLIADDAAMTEFKIKFLDWQKLGNDLLGVLEKMKDELRDKSRAAFLAVVRGWQS